jgi:FdhD protein
MTRWQVQRWQANRSEEHSDFIVMEEPFEVRVNGQSLATIMRTPTGLEVDRELALGFLLTEGILNSPEIVLAITRPKDSDGLPEENVVEVQLSHLPPALAPNSRGESHFERRFVVGSSCGLCGKTSINEVCQHLPALPPDNFGVTSARLYSMPQQLREAQALFDSTGGLHAAGLFEQDGTLLLLREDIGRHNAVDKLIGRMALDGNFPLKDKMLLVSGRVSFEIVQKALAAQIALIAAVSAPSSLALELAQEAGITLIGFLRGQQMNVYTHSRRVVAE